MAAEGPDLYDALSVIIALVSLFLAALALDKGGRASSASAIAAMYDGFRDRWISYLGVPPQDRFFHCAELVNYIELGCAFCLEGSISGTSAEMLEEQLCRMLQHLEEDSEVRAHMRAMRTDPSVFKYIARFLVRHRRQGTYARVFATAMAEPKPAPPPTPAVVAAPAGPQPPSQT